MFQHATANIADSNCSALCTTKSKRAEAGRREGERARAFPPSNLHRLDNVQGDPGKRAYLLGNMVEHLNEVKASEEPNFQTTQHNTVLALSHHGVTLYKHVF